jgi:hypothetical protein
MTEIEQLRKELNELRERVAILERQRYQSPPAFGTWPRQEPYAPTNPYQPPFVVTCETGK